MQEKLRFDGRVAVITGAGRGVGRAHALMLAERGCAVVVNDIGYGVPEGGATSAAPADEVVAEIVAKGGHAVANHDDAATAEGCARMVEQALDGFGGVDIVIPNAGTSQPVLFADMAFADFEFMMRTHLYSSFHVIKAAWPHLARARYGRIVMTTSGVGMFGSVRSVHYGTAKGAIYGMTRGLALEGEPDGIAVNAFWPSAFTRLVRGDDDLVARMVKAMPVDRATPVAAWLAHESCDVTGQLLHGGSGRASRVFVAETVGYHTADLTIEDVARNKQAIFAEDGYFVFKAAIDSSRQQTRLTT